MNCFTLDWRVPSIWRNRRAIGDGGRHSASRSSPCARGAGRWPAQPATIADRTTRTPASRGAIADQDHSRVPMAVAARLPGGRHQAVRSLPLYQRLNATHRQRAATSSRKRHSHAPCGGTRSIGSHIARSVRSACWAALRRSLGTPRARPPIMAAMAPKNKSLAQINKSAGGGRATNEAFGPT